MTPTLDRNSLEWRAAQVAAAFGVEEWHLFQEHSGTFYFESKSPDFKLMWEIKGSALPHRIRLYDSEILDCVQLCLRCGGEWELNLPRNWRGGWKIGCNLMARGLYCLGFSDESVLSQLPELSAHEKLELHFSMPREFWPQAWLGELSATL